MSGYIIKTINGEEIWNGTGWTPAMYANPGRVKVFKTRRAAEQEASQMNEERPGIGLYIIIVEA